MRIQTERALVWWALLLGLALFWSVALTLAWCSLAQAQEQTSIVPAGQSFTMGWTPGTNAEGYEVEQALDQGPYQVLGDVTETQIDSVLGDLETARYRVRGFKMVVVEDIPQRIVGPYSDPSDRILGVVIPGQPGKPGVQ